MKQKNIKGRKIDLKAEIAFSMSEAFGLLMANFWCTWWWWRDRDRGSCITKHSRQSKMLTYGAYALSHAATAEKDMGTRTHHEYR